MNPPSDHPAPTGCEAVQERLSEIADTGEPLPSELRAHLSSCDACARFADQWLAGPPAVLSQPAPPLPGTRMRERILDAADAAALPPNVVRFQPAADTFAASSARASWHVWPARLAACAVLAGFSYWLLNPVRSTVRPVRSAAPAPTLAQSLTQLEDQSKNEQEALQSAFVKGGRRVHGTAARSMAALEL